MPSVLKVLLADYHYLVPQWSDGISFSVDTEKLLAEIHETRSLGINPRRYSLARSRFWLSARALTASIHVLSQTS